MKISSFNPFSSDFHAIRDFQSLDSKTKFLTIALTVLATIASLPILGIGGVLTFSFLTARFSVIKLDLSKSPSSPDVETARKTGAQFEIIKPSAPTTPTIPPSETDKENEPTVSPVSSDTETAPPGNQQIIGPLPKESPFQSFKIRIGKSFFTISSIEEIQLKVHELDQQFKDNHIQLELYFPYYDFKDLQTKQFVEALRTVVDVIIPPKKEVPEGLLYIEPKKIEEYQGDLIIRKYDNGIIEEVHSDKKFSWEKWNGRRLYPSGVIETGFFWEFCLHKGTRVENEITTYRLPDTLLESYDLNLALMPIDIEGKKQLSVINKKHNSVDDKYDYIQVDEEVIPTIAKILQNEKFIKEESLKVILSEFIDCVVKIIKNQPPRNHREPAIWRFHFSAKQIII